MKSHSGKSHVLGEQGDSSSLTEDEISRLRLFNERMRELGREIQIEGSRQVELLAKRVADPLDPLDDFEIEADMSFILREDDPAYFEDDDNVLTRRIHYIPKNRQSNFDRYECAGVVKFGIENHSYIFYDLHSMSYGLEQQALSLKDILRIGEVWIDVDIRVQMFRKIRRA